MTSPTSLFSTLPSLSPDCWLFSSPAACPLPAYELIARKCSNVLNAMMNTKDFQEKRILHLNLRTANSDTCLRKAFEYTLTGDLNLQDCTIEQMASIADELEMNDLRDRMKIPKPAPMTINTNLFPLNPNILNILYNPNAYWQMILALNNMSHAQQVEMVAEDKVTKKKSRDRKPSNSADVDEPYDNMGDVIIPSTDNEGWCRNKKYIEKTEQGFRCTVCKKVYGRYNSVSYHVTIYHRNPPIKCDIAGCQFTTREARYIHFHKYYRHGIALPTTIDQGTRKCQFCRHVAKSPAMLEKHIKRHQNIEVNKADDLDRTTVHDSELLYGRPRTLSQTTTTTTTTEPMDLDIDATKPRARTL